MAFLHVYIGRLDDPKFSWDGGDWNGNIPKRISPFFPYRRVTDENDRVFWQLVNGIEAGTYEGKKTDWSGWVAKMTKQQIQAFIHEQYPRPEELLEGAQRDYRELQDTMATLEDGPLYGLVAAEFPSEADADL